MYAIYGQNLHLEFAEIMRLLETTFKLIYLIFKLSKYQWGCN